MNVGVVAFVATALMLAGCSGDDDGSGDAATGDPQQTSSTSAVTVPEVEEFTGTVEEFYEVPDPLPTGEPGALIRTMPLEAAEGEAASRIMYLSTDADGDSRAATGVVYYPTEAPPEDGWPVVAWAHGTSGLASQCAPSRTPEVPPTFGARGVRVAADYIGLGPVGEIHPYLSAVAEGHAMIDSVAAVQSMPEVNAGSRWVVAGISQGGHAALVTNEMAADRLPDSELVGAVAYAPASQLGESYGDEIQTRAVSALVLFSMAAEDPNVDPADYLANDALEPVRAAVEDGCSNDMIDSLVPLAMSDDLFTQDPRTSPLGEEWLAENDPGQTASPAPLLLVQGGQDILVLPARTDALEQRLCSVGQILHRIDLPEAGHDSSVMDLSESEVSAWIDARFAGEPAPADC